MKPILKSLEVSFQIKVHIQLLHNVPRLPSGGNKMISWWVEMYGICIGYGLNWEHVRGENVAWS